MRISRLVLTGAAIGTIIGTGRADLNRTHVFNPAWPPHARFHGAAGWGTVACSQLLAVWLLWRPSLLAADRDLPSRPPRCFPRSRGRRSFSRCRSPVPRLRTTRGISPGSRVCPPTSCPPR